MKLKKLFAGVVAVAMMATMAMPSFAARPKTGKTVDADNHGKVSINLNYTGSGFGTDATGLEMDNGGKAYALEDSSLTGDDKQTAMDLTISDATDTPAKEGAENKLTIQLPLYSHVGTYFYKINQKASATNGMTHGHEADSPLYVMVHVINEDGTDLSKTGLKCKVAVMDANPLEDGTTPSKIESVTNNYNKADVTVKKVVKGDMGDRNQVFKFKVVLTKTAAVNGTITFTAPGKTPVTVNSTDWAADNTYTTAIFEMKHGESATFANLPYGVSAEAFEVDADGNSVGDAFGTYTVSGNASKVTVAADSNNEIVITNTSTVNVDTGVILDNAPYILMLTVVAAGAMTLVIKKRREEE